MITQKLRTYRRIGPPPLGFETWPAYFDHADQHQVISNLRIEAGTVTAYYPPVRVTYCPHCGKPIDE